MVRLPVQGCSVWKGRPAKETLVSNLGVFLVLPSVVSVSYNFLVTNLHFDEERQDKGNL